MYKASKHKNYKLVNKLQKYLFKSSVAKFLAIRQITPLKMGKKTADIDGMKELNSKQSVRLANEVIYKI